MCKSQVICVYAKQNYLFLSSVSVRLYTDRWYDKMAIALRRLVGIASMLLRTMLCGFTVVALFALASTVAVPFSYFVPVTRVVLPPFVLANIHPAPRAASLYDKMKVDGQNGFPFQTFLLYSTSTCLFSHQTPAVCHSCLEGQSLVLNLSYGTIKRTSWYVKNKRNFV